MVGWCECFWILYSLLGRLFIDYKLMMENKIMFLCCLLVRVVLFKWLDLLLVMRILMYI